MTALTDVSNVKIIWVDDAELMTSAHEFHLGDQHNQKSHGRRGNSADDGGKKPFFHVLPKAERGKSGDGRYHKDISGMWGKYGAAGIMMRHVDDEGTARYMVVQRVGGKGSGAGGWRWQLPGGALEEKETDAQGAAREVTEELGFSEAYLAKLKPRGVHKVELPVPDMDPWHYSNMTADVPYMLKPKIDYGELGAARWLTEEQLREMMTRGRLVKPFHDNFDKILAQFDQPITAAGDPNWDPLEHPKGPDGKFIKKGTSAYDAAVLDAKYKDIATKLSQKQTAKNVAFLGGDDYLTAILAAEIDDLGNQLDEAENEIITFHQPKTLTTQQLKNIKDNTKTMFTKTSGGTPIKAWTKTIYNKTYDSGGVVATKLLDGGKRIDILWMGKEFEEWEYDPATGGGKKLGTYGKGKLYAKVKKETGWLEPIPFAQGETVTVVDVDDPNTGLDDALGMQVSIGQILDDDENLALPSAKALLASDKTIQQEYISHLVDMESGEFEEWIDKSGIGSVMAQIDGNVQDEIWQIAMDQGLENKLSAVLGIDTPDNLTPPTPIVIPKTPPTPAPANLDPKSKLHLDAIAAVDKHSIYEPAIGTSDFKSVTPAGMSAIQANMFTASNVNWSSAQKAAINSYTNKVGYQTVNAVLRHDTKRMNMFNDAQLQDAVKRAGLMQSAMLPLTEDVQLYRGVNAEQFGFATGKVSLDKLKALEGKTIQDNGFHSTTVVKNPTVSYDYASKKSIRVVVNAPKGTPGLWVSSATSWTEENEFILAAGTNFKIDSVVAATDDDKKNFGSSLEQIVTVTVIPGKKAQPKVEAGTPTPAVPTPNAPTPAPSAAPAAPKSFFQDPANLPVMTFYEVSKFMDKLTPETYHGYSPAEKNIVNETIGALESSNLQEKLDQLNATPPPAIAPTPTIAPTPASAAIKWFPIKLNTATIHKAQYDHGQVVAVNSDGSKRIFWNNITKKFVTQDAKPQFDSWVASETDTKKSLYDKHKNSKGWYAPQQKLDVFAADDTQNPKPSQSNPLKPFVSIPGPGAPAAAPSVFDIMKLNGDISTVQPAAAKKIFDTYKKGASVGIGNVFASSNPEKKFKVLVATTHEINGTLPVGKKLNNLQVLNLVDQEAAKAAGVPDQGLYTSSVVAWLKTPEGKKYAPEIIANSMNPSALANVGKTVTATPSAPAGAGIKPDVQAVLDTMKPAYSIGTPKTGVTSFPNITVGDATDMQAEMHKIAGKKGWDAKQKAAIKNYTGSGSTSINTMLYSPNSTWGGTGTAQQIVDIQAAMLPLTRSFTLHRATNSLGKQFDSYTLADWKKLEGKTIEHPSFLGGSVGAFSAFEGKTLSVKVQVPAGTPGVYVDNISQHKGERELLLAGGLRYEVLSITSTGNTYGAKFTINLRVVPE